MTTGGSQDRSDLELRDAVLAGWQRLIDRVQSSDDQLGTLVDRTGMPFRRLDMARRVRNKIAHAKPASRERLLEASRTIAEAEQQLTSREPKPDQSGRQATRTTTRQVAEPTPPNRYPAIGFRRRLGLNQPAPHQQIPRDQALEPAQRDNAKRQARQRHLEFHTAADQRSAPQLIPLRALGLNPRAATVTVDVPWLYGAIIGDVVKLIAAPLEPDTKYSGSARIDSQDGSVTITVDAFTPPLPRKTHPTTPTNYRNTIRDEIRDGVAAAAYVALVVGGLILLIFLAGRLA